MWFLVDLDANGPTQDRPSDEVGQHASKQADTADCEMLPRELKGRAADCDGRNGSS